MNLRCAVWMFGGETLVMEGFNEMMIRWLLSPHLLTTWATPNTTPSQCRMYGLPPPPSTSPMVSIPYSKTGPSPGVKCPKRRVHLGTILVMPGGGESLYLPAVSSPLPAISQLFSSRLINPTCLTAVEISGGGGQRWETGAGKMGENEWYRSGIIERRGEDHVWGGWAVRIVSFHWPAQPDHCLPLSS